MSLETMPITRHERADIKERPISFSTRMVFEILQGRKTETRRLATFNERSIVKPQTIFDSADIYKILGIQKYGKKGDRLWVKETYATRIPDNHAPNQIWYKADYIDRKKATWKSGRFMPKIMSRITLEITSLTVQRLQDITEKQAKAEGVPAVYSYEKTIKHYMTMKKIKPSHRLGYRYLWDFLYAKKGYGWETNPFVWRIQFKVVKPNNNNEG